MPSRVTTKSSTSARRSSSHCMLRTCQATWASSLPTGSSTTSSPRTQEVRRSPAERGGRGPPGPGPAHLLVSGRRHHHGAGVPDAGAEGGPLCGPRLGAQGSLGPGQLPPLLSALLARALYVWLPRGQVCRPGAQGRPQGNDQNVCEAELSPWPSALRPHRRPHPPVRTSDSPGLPPSVPGHLSPSLLSTLGPPRWSLHLPTHARRALLRGPVSHCSGLPCPFASLCLLFASLWTPLGRLLAPGSPSSKASAHLLQRSCG